MNKPFMFLPDVYDQFGKLSNGGIGDSTDSHLLSQIKISNDMLGAIYNSVGSVDIHNVSVSKISRYMVTFSIHMSQNGSEVYDRTYDVGFPGVRSVIESEGEFVMINEVRPDGSYLTCPGGAFDAFYKTYNSEDFVRSSKEAMKKEIVEEIGLDIDISNLEIIGSFNPMPAYISTLIYGFYLKVTDDEFKKMCIDLDSDEEIISSIRKVTKSELMSEEVCGESLALMTLYDLWNSL